MPEKNFKPPNRELNDTQVSSKMNSTNKNDPNSNVQDVSAKNLRVSSYTAALQRDIFPSRAQAIILDAKVGCTLTDYTVAVGSIVKAENIIYASRISNGRICIYLKNKELVENLTEKFEFLEVGENKDKTAIRPLVSKQQRIIISNVAPPIPHHIIVDKFDNIGIKCAPITTLRAGIAEKGYEHVLSSRRQTFIKKEDLSKLPEFFKIVYEEISYYVYPSIGILKCFECREEGHIRLHCPKLICSTPQNKGNEAYDPSSEQVLVNIPSNDSQNPDVNSAIDKSSDFTLQENVDVGDLLNSTIISTSASKENNPTFIHPTLPVQKRALNTSGSSNNDDSSNDHKKPKRSHKKVSFKEVNEQLKSIQPSILENSSSYPISYNKLVEFLTMVHGVSNVREVSLKFTSNYTALKKMLQDVHDYTDNRNLKSRINRIIKRLDRNSSQASDSELSQSDCG